MLMSPQQLIEAFNPLSNWQDRYRQLIVLAKSVPAYPEHLKIEQNQIYGCENKVWLTYQQQEDNTFVFYMESEGRIVKGLLAVILIFINGKTCEQIHQLDLLEIFKQLNIINELSESRRHGLDNIIQHINTIVLSEK